MVIERKRHIAKSISYRIISTLIGFVTISILTGNILVGTTFSIAELIWKPIQYYYHERIWYKFIKYGIKKD